MKTLKNLCKKLYLLMLTMMVSTVSFTMEIAGQPAEVDRGMLDLFNGMFRFSRTMLLAIQILVTIVILIIMAWQVVNFMTGQQVDLGKVIMYGVGGITILILVWILPKVATNTKVADKGTADKGAIINIEKIDTSKPKGFEIHGAELK